MGRSNIPGTEGEHPKFFPSVGRQSAEDSDHSFKHPSLLLRVLYESDDKGVHYYRLLELEPNQDNLNEAIYTVIRRSTAANIQYGIGIITIDKNGYLLETPFDNILKINSILPIGRI